MSPETNHSVIPRPSQGFSSAIENSEDLVLIHLTCQDSFEALHSHDISVLKTIKWDNKLFYFTFYRCLWFYQL